MTSTATQGKRLRGLLARGELLVAPGCFDALSAMLVEQAGFEVAYATGGGIARAAGLPDLGLISAKEIADRFAEITASVSVPVLGDADNGYGNALNARHAVKAFERAGVAGLHLEDQSLPKRCGHLADKTLVSQAEFVDKLKAVRDVADPELLLIARTDAIAVEGLDRALERALAYKEAGADMLFVEAPTSLEQIEAIAATVPGPKLLNMFTTGRTPIVPLPRLKELGFSLVIVPGDTMRAAIHAMRVVLAALRETGNTLGLEDQMVSFDERERVLGTERYFEVAARFSGR